MRFKTIAVLLLFHALGQFAVNSMSGCSRSPTNLPHERRMRGDNGYKLIVADKANAYIPGKTYNVLLVGSRTYPKVQHFTHFKIMAEAHNNGKWMHAASPHHVGRFQLYSDSLTKFSDRCVNTISEATDLPKTEVQVMWVAPESGSGCVSLRAMVYEGPRSWFSDDGELTQVICERTRDATDVRMECCACDEAKYSFTFEGIWSNKTHPKDYPFAIWLTHFSDVIGASHESNFSFWGDNHIATDAFRSLAEWGSPTALEGELRAYGPKLRTLIKAAGLWYPYVNSNTSSKFKVDRIHPKVSLVSMFGPSPDWVVGISGENLCNADCTWKESLDIDLYPWDAGTDGGISYMSPNSETIPRERMYRITTMYPEDPRAPFYDPGKKEMTPLARLYIRREKIIPKSCDTEFLQALKLDVSDAADEHDAREECRVSSYTAWSPCSVTCGKGIRMRTREYMDETVAKAAGCTKQLISKEMCVADIAECEGSENATVKDDDDEGENLSNSQSLITDNGEGAGICKTTPWSAWSECSASCGIGITMRTRTFLTHIGRKRCPHISIVEKNKCMRPECKFEDIELPDPFCPTTQWSDWSPCSTTCGNGVTIRTRLVLLEDGPEKVNCTARMELHQQKACKNTNDCSIDMTMAKDICSQHKDAGPCRGNYARYTFNSGTGRCEIFIYGGCRGNQNNFLTESDCLLACSVMSVITLPSTPASSGRQFPDENISEGCIMSEWSNWTECSVRCGLGYSERYRYIISEPKNGGQLCSKRTVKRRRCTSSYC